MPTWNFLSELRAELSASARHELPAGTATSISDRIIAALSREDRAGLAEAQSALESFYLARLNLAPAPAIAAARGDGDADDTVSAAFSLGQIGLAHAVVARAASRRVDDAFERRLRSKPLERYVRLLIDAELSGVEIAEQLKKHEAEVSRRLKLLRQMGAVECRREGNRVINFLTPAAKAVARARNMGALGAGAHPGQMRPDVLDALDGHRKELPRELRTSLVLVGSHDRLTA